MVYSFEFFNEKTDNIIIKTPKGITDNKVYQILYQLPDKKPIRGMYYGPAAELQKLRNGEVDDISELKHVGKD